MDKYKIFIQKDVKPCEKVWKRDIGFNVKALTDPQIKGQKYIDGLYKSIDYIEYETGVRIDPLQRASEELIYINLYPRSSISKYNLFLANSIGLIDPDFRDPITARFKYVTQPEDLVILKDQIYIRPNMNKIYKIGDQIAQLVFCKNINVEFDFVESLIETGRGGFGSTGV